MVSIQEVTPDNHVGTGWGARDFRRGGVDGRHGVHAVVACRGEVGADPAEPAEGALGVPVSGHGVMSFGVFDCSFTGFISLLDIEGGGEQPDLAGVVGQPARQGRIRGGASCQSRWRLWVWPNATASS